VIGHCKSDHRMGRCYLKGQLGDGLNALGAAFGFNLRKVLPGAGRKQSARWLELYQGRRRRLCRWWLR